MKFKDFKNIVTVFIIKNKIVALSEWQDDQKDTG